MIHFLFATEMEAAVLNGVHGKFTSDILGWGISECRKNIPEIMNKYGSGTYVLCGIAGAYPQSGLNIGDVVEVVGEQYENDACILSNLCLTTLPQVKSLTVSQCNRPHGNQQIENMEGAPFFEEAIRRGVPFTQIRAISNITDDAKENWRIGIALDNLKKILTTQIICKR